MRSGRRPLTRLRGQHFLTDARVAEQMAAAAELAKGDTVLEVGPGLGALTRALLPRAGRVIAVELDPYFAATLREEFGDAGNLEVVEGDIRTLDVESFTIQDSSFKIVSNLPYNITSDFFRASLTARALPECIVAMVQEEVALRIAAPRPPIGMLTLLCQLHADCSIVRRVPPGAFAPPPKVGSAVVRLEVFDADEFSGRWGIPRAVAPEVLSFASRAFRNPRKKLPPQYRHALRSQGESDGARPASLSVEKWVKLWRAVR